MSVEFDSGFDADQVPEDKFSPLPEGSYTVVITESELKATKSGDGQYIKTTMQVVDGEQKGRLIWGSYNIKHPNPETVRIATRQLADVCQAVGVPRPKNSGELHNKPFVIDVKVEERKDSPGEYQNRIKKYRPCGAAPASQTAPAAGGDNTPPWAKRS